MGIEFSPGYPIKILARDILYSPPYELVLQGYTKVRTNWLDQARSGELDTNNSFVGEFEVVYKACDVVVRMIYCFSEVLDDFIYIGYRVLSIEQTRPASISELNAFWGKYWGKGT